MKDEGSHQTLSITNKLSNFQHQLVSSARDEFCQNSQVFPNIHCKPVIFVGDLVLAKLIGAVMTSDWNAGGSEGD